MTRYERCGALPGRPQQNRRLHDLSRGLRATARAWWAEPILDLSECPRASLTCQAIVNFRSGAAVALREPGRYGREAEREFMAETGTTDFGAKRRKASLQNLRPAQCSSLLSSRSLLSNLRRTTSAILWRHKNGAKWRSLPSELGPWWMAAQTLIRWARLGGSAC